jgi:hypothetical protein
MLCFVSVVVRRERTGVADDDSSFSTARRLVKTRLTDHYILLIVTTPKAAGFTENHASSLPLDGSASHKS